MKMIIFLLCIGSLGCQSLPASIAEHTAETAKSCAPAARQTAKALVILGYRGVAVCAGEALPGVGHAWVEYQDAGEVIVLDPFALTGSLEYYREDTPPGTYIVRAYIPQK